MGNYVWPIEWHDCQRPWVRLKVTFALLKLYNTHNLWNIPCFNSVCLHITWKAHAVCDLNIIVSGEWSCMPSLDPKLLVLGTKSPSPWSWRIFIKQIRNLSISKHERNSLWLFSNLWTKNNFATARLSSPSVVNSRPTTVACRSHSASSFVHSTMTTGCDLTRRAVRCCQPRLVIQH